MRPSAPSICLCLAFLAGCVEFPELDAKLSEEARDADRPELGFNRVLIEEGENETLGLEELEAMVSRLETVQDRMQADLANPIIAGADRKRIDALAADLRAEAAVVEKRIAAELAAAQAESAPGAADAERLRRLDALRKSATDTADTAPEAPQIDLPATTGAPTDEELERLRRLQELRQRATEPAANTTGQPPVATIPRPADAVPTEAEIERLRALEELRKRAGRVAQDE